MNEIDRLIGEVAPDLAAMFDADGRPAPGSILEIVLTADDVSMAAASLISYIETTFGVTGDQTDALLDRLADAVDFSADVEADLGQL